MYLQVCQVEGGIGRRQAWTLTSSRYLDHVDGGFGHVVAFDLADLVANSSSRWNRVANARWGSPLSSERHAGNLPNRNQVEANEQHSLPLFVRDPVGGFEGGWLGLDAHDAHRKQHALMPCAIQFTLLFGGRAHTFSSPNRCPPSAV